ncbi:MAG TPA: hypothetical protein VHX17_04725 [Candidatus Cybelea sp.]|jgi:hypothetical protein|nr:hypothetical protein [Candidatus Cybelea sp.]
MLSSSRAPAAALGFVLLTACGGGALSPGAPVREALGDLRPPGPPVNAPAMQRGRAAPARVRSGIYVAQFSSSYVFGYPLDNSKNGAPICNIYNPYQSVNDIAVDAGGNLLIPLEVPNEILVYKGTRLCGPWAATIADPYGQPTGAAANDAMHGTIAVANIFDLSGPGSISLCTMSGGCTQNLTNPALYETGGVAMDRKGNCWASGLDGSYASVLIYFAACSGSGVAATGIAVTQGYGAIDLDKNGNLVVVSIPNSVYVYGGCKPKCKKIGGPFTLQGGTIFGHLNKKSTEFAGGDYELGQVDIYDYTPKSLTYRYSFNSGLSASADVGGVAFSPRSKE